MRRAKLLKWIGCVCVIGLSAVSRADTLVEFGGETVWRYRVGLPSGVDWRSADFDDSDWKYGRSPIGHDAARIITRISDVDGVPHAICLRKSFRLAQTPEDSMLVIWLRYDDGALVYINDNEVVRANLAPDVAKQPVHALSEMMGSDGLVYHRHVVPTDCLKQGDNIVAVEVYQARGESAHSTDIAFDLRLSSYASGNIPPPVRTAKLKLPARAATEAYHRRHYVGPDMKIPDGYVDGGRGMRVKGDGTAWSYREVISVDRSRDAALRESIEYAKSDELMELNPVDRATRLARYVQKLMTPGNQQDALRRIVKLQTLYEGREVLLGDIPKMCDAGVCRHRSLLFKILADAAGLHVALVRGNYGQGGHAWNELHLNNGDVRIVDVMNPQPDFYFPTTDERAARYYRTIKNERMYEVRKKVTAPSAR